MRQAQRVGDIVLPAEAAIRGLQHEDRAQREDEAREGRQDHDLTRLRRGLDVGRHGAGDHPRRGGVEGCTHVYF